MSNQPTLDYSGYHDCPCRDCFEIAIGEGHNGDPALCHDCESAGCDASGESECEVILEEYCDCGLRVSLAVRGRRIVDFNNNPNATIYHASTHYCEPEHRATLGIGLRDAKQATRGRTEAELAHALNQLGITAFAQQKRSDLACMLQNALIDVWFPEHEINVPERNSDA